MKATSQTEGDWSEGLVRGGRVGGSWYDHG